MAEEIEIAESLSSAVKQKGFRRYIWLYFVVVPLTAVSASTVAVMITSLQGLGLHEMAFTVYALVLLVGVKLLLCIGGSYLLALIFALFSIRFVARRMSEYNAFVQSHLRDKGRSAFVDPAEDVRARELAGRVASMLGKVDRTQGLWIGISVVYGFVFLIASSLWFVSSDAGRLWHIINDIAMEQRVVEPGSGQESAETDEGTDTEQEPQ